jgi:hypothetical protein
MKELLAATNNAILRTSFGTRLFLRGLIVGIVALISYQFFPSDSSYRFAIIVAAGAVVGGLWWRQSEMTLWQRWRSK